jgi:hypothetical protein
MNLKNIAALGAIATLSATVIFTPTQAHAMTGEEAVRVIKVIGDYMENLQKIFQPAPTEPQPPTAGGEEGQPEPDPTEFESN